MPVFGISLAVHTSDKNDLLTMDTIEERIWKPVKEGASSIAMNSREPIWVLFDGTKNQGDLFQKFFP